MRSLRNDVQHLINSYSRENVSGTPDLVLADYLLGALELFEKATNERDRWWGFEPKIGGSIPAKGELGE